MGSVGDSWTVRGLGTAVNEAEPEKRDWLRFLYSNTVPSPRPTARWESVADKATAVIYRKYELWVMIDVITRHAQDGAVD